ncbi:MAG: multidrug effflux MFS transporter [Candidatus Sumerlaeia bacterium]
MPRTEPLTTPVDSAYARRIAFTLGFLAACGPFAVDMYLPGLPDVARELRTSLAAVQNTLAIYIFGLAFGQVVWGTLCDRFGRRVPLLAGAVLFTAMAAVCAVTRSINTLLAARFFMGLGGSAGVVVSRAIVRDLFEEHEAARCYSMMMIIGGIGPIVAPFLGSLLLTYFNWRSIFWTVTGFGCLCVAALMRNIPETLAPENRMRGHLMNVVRGYGRILVNGRFLAPALAVACTTGILFTYIANSSYLFRELFGVPVKYFGFLFATNSIGLYVAGQSNRLLLRHFTSDRLMRAGMWANLAMAALLTACAATGLGGFPAVFILLFLCLSTLGIIFPNATAMVMQPFGAEAGFASAMLGILQYLISAAGGALIGLFQTGTPLPMAVQILAFGLVAKAMLLLTPRR